MTLYVRIPNYIEIKRNLLEIKKDIYLTLKETLDIVKEREKRKRLILEAYTKIREIENDLRKLKEVLPKEEIKKIKGIEEIEKKVKEEEKKIEEEIKKEEVKIIKEEEKDELKMIEEELKKIEEELKSLL